MKLRRSCFSLLSLNFVHLFSSLFYQLMHEKHNIVFTLECFDLMQELNFLSTTYESIQSRMINITMFFQLSTGSLVQHNEHIIFGQKKPLLFGILKSLDLLDISGLSKLQVIRISLRKLSSTAELSSTSLNISIKSFVFGTYKCVNSK